MTLRILNILILFLVVGAIFTWHNERVSSAKISEKNKEFQKSDISVENVFLQTTKEMTIVMMEKV